MGHFPDFAVMPGVLIVEAMAQAAGALVVHTLGLTSREPHRLLHDHRQGPLPPSRAARRDAAHSGEGASPSRAGVEIRGQGLCRRHAVRGGGIQRDDPRRHRMAMGIHPTAMIEDGARLGAGRRNRPVSVSSAARSRWVRAYGSTRHVVVHGNTEIGARTQYHLARRAGRRSADALARSRRRKAARDRRRQCHSRRRHDQRGSHAGRGITTIGDSNYLMARQPCRSRLRRRQRRHLSQRRAARRPCAGRRRRIMGGLAAAQQFGRIGRYALISGLSGVNDGCHSLRHGDRPALPPGRTQSDRPQAPRNPARKHPCAACAVPVRSSSNGTDRSTKTPSARRTATGCAFPKWPKMVGFILADAKRPICPGAQTRR